MQIIHFLACLLFLLENLVSCYYELVEELGCHNTLYRLTCVPHDGQILILEAMFSLDDSFLAPLGSSCGSPGVPSNTSSKEHDRISFRQAINKRCSGKNFCSFSLLEDHKDSLKWGAGTVYIRYACSDGSHILRTCSASVLIKGEGFVQTPGYPSYYVGGRNCHWTFRAPPNRQVQLQFLDISIRGVGPREKGCKDWLLVTENSLNILAECGDVLSPQIITSSAAELNVTLLTTSQFLFPKRGLLFHYKAVGCIVPNPPEDGYLVTKNNSMVHFRCNLAYNFPDTGLRDRIINCHELDIDLPNCAYVGVNESLDNSILSFRHNLTSEIRSSNSKNDTMSDIVAPAIIVSLLFIGNALLVGAIYVLKKRQKVERDPWDCDETDFKALS